MFFISLSQLVGKATNNPHKVLEGELKKGELPFFWSFLATRFASFTLRSLFADLCNFLFAPFLSGNDVSISKNSGRF